jgi:hypothetical protein
MTITANESKATLKQILLQHNGDTSHPSVQNAISHLQQHLDTYQDQEMDIHTYTGRWRSISTPPFPGRLKEDDAGKARYTLGRMSFGMFKPTAVICTVEEIVNVIEPLEDTSHDGEQSRSYNFEVSMKIHVPDTDIQLFAKLVNYGICTLASSTRLEVKFHKGQLTPDFDMQEDDILITAWKQIFDGAIAKEQDNSSLLKKITTSAGNIMMKWMMGLEPPDDRPDMTQTYRIARPIAGFLDILFVDEDLRISRGNRGTVVVVERI